MASPSSSFSPRNWSYNVFPSFHGPDVRKTFLSNMREQFTRNGITMFDDQEIERSKTIAPSLTEAIRESRISIVILSKNYASSGWCLDELVEILECKKAMGQTVMTIFYGVEPSHVRKQNGEFGVSFDETCTLKTDEERQKWSKALNEVGNIAGEDFFKWDNEANMIKKIARDVSDKLNATPSRDFDGMVGLETHLRIMTSLLDLDYEDGVKMVAISGPAGIGKTTIAKELHGLLSNRFQLSCFMDNLRGSYVSGQDKLRLQEKFLSKVLNQDGVRVCHSGVIQERLCKQRVLIILDDVNNIKQLEALANETTWFGPGSRIVVTTENKELLQQHGIDNMYHVGFPSDEEALKILCSYAFRKIPMYHGFGGLAETVTELCGNLPLALSVVGSSLRGNNKEEWEQVIHRLETILDQDIEEVLKVGYESLDESEQSLYLHIAVFFNYKDGDLVETMFTDRDLDVKQGLKILVNRSLIEISTYGGIMMHRLLQQVGKKAIHEQEPWKRKILIDAPEICDVLEHAYGTRAVSGISFDICAIEEVSINKKAFKRMPNLRFLSVYKSRNDGNDRVHIPEEMEFPHRLRLLDWEAYPSKSLHPTFHPEYLVELNFENSELEKLWGGRQVLTNLKKLNLTASRKLKELPDLSNATNLEELNILCCESLVKIPSSCSHLHKLQKLLMNSCTSLEFFPAHMNLASLEEIFMGSCLSLRNMPVMSTNITLLYISDSAVEDLPSSIRLCSRLKFLYISYNANFKGITHLPTSLIILSLDYSDIERLPDCIKDLHQLESLNLRGCTSLASLPELPPSLKSLDAEDCESLKTVLRPLNTSNAEIAFTNCFKLSEQARRSIIQPSLRNMSTHLPGKKVPAEFEHRGRGNSLTIPPEFNNRSSSRFVVCVVISNNQDKITEEEYDSSEPLSRPCKWDFDPEDGVVYVDVFKVLSGRKEHVFIFHSRFPFKDPSDVSREIVFEFSRKLHGFEIIECGAKILNDEIGGSYESGGLGQVFEEDIEFVPSEEESYFYDFSNGVICGSKEVEKLEGGQNRSDCWSWLFLCFGLSVLGKKG